MDCERPSDEAGDAQRAARGGDVPEFGLEEDILSELNELRGILMGFARGAAERAAVTREPEPYAKLNNAAVKTARAVRQIAVLQLEMIGKRQPAGSRAPREAQAKQAEVLSPEEAKAQSQRERFPDGLPYEYGDYDDYDDYTDEEQRERMALQLFMPGGPLLAAINADFKAAGREDILGQSAITKHQLIYNIPHPNLDRAIAEANIFLVLDGYYKMGMLPPTPGTGPPGLWEKFKQVHQMEADSGAAYGLDPRPE